MAVQAYIDRKFRAETLLVIQDAAAICAEYAAQNFVITLRQLYYQMVARNLFPDSWIDPAYNRTRGLPPDTKNTDKNYDRFGSIINDARLAGKLDWEYMEDRTRNMKRIQTWDSVRQIIDAVRYSFRLNPWDAQPKYVQVWVEKEALEGVIARPCERFRLPYIACKGYMSQSEMRDQALKLQQEQEDGKEVWILHFGDHDPSGIQMSEDIQQRMEMFMGGVNFRRLALNMPQIRALNPPPNPAKINDSRYKSYVEQFGVEDSWELDALNPQQMADLIDEAMNDLIDWDAWGDTLAREEDDKQILVALQKNWADVAAWMRERGMA